MANAVGSFRAPMTLAQDLAMIMEFVDTPQTDPQLSHGRGISSEAARDDEDDISSSSDGSETESEEEVEAEIVLEYGAAAEPDSSDSDSTSSSINRASPSAQDRKKGSSSLPAVIDLDLDEDGPPPVAYVPSAHELPPTAIPIPPLPDPSTLPLDPLEYVGELVTILQDTVIVRGAGTGSQQARRDAALDEGSLLLFEDRTMLGHVWETFGPTALPHYVVRINRAGRSEYKKSADVQSSASDVSSHLPLEHEHAHSLDPAMLKVSAPVYHIPSLSNFVFPSALARLKGSDASNFHDEEPADHELEFSDDEAEVAHKRLRERPAGLSPITRNRGSSSRASSAAPRQQEGDAMSGAGLLYSTLPYDADDIPASDPAPENGTGNSVKLGLQDPAVHDALMLVRNSRSRRSSMSMSMAESSPHTVAGSSQITRDTASSWGRTRGLSRARGRAPQAPAHPPFSFDEYDPHMPRPPSPTSVAIARATGQWRDGTPFVYPSTAPLHPPPSPFPPAYQPHVYYDAYSQTVAPHINPRFAFAQALGVQPSSTVQPLDAALLPSAAVGDINFRRLEVDEPGPMAEK